MASGAFDIYQTHAGYCAVHNDVQRQILDALSERDLQLPELVRITGKSKPTLSGGHIKELLGRELIEERDHPDDKRRKIYRLAAHRIGSSDIPVPSLREAVRKYVALAPFSGQIALAAAVSALGKAPAGVPAEAVRGQAYALGKATGAAPFADLAEAWSRVSRFLEDQQVARVVQLDVPTAELVVEPLFTAAKSHRTAILAGLLEGILHAALIEHTVRGKGAPNGRVHLACR